MAETTCARSKSQTNLACKQLYKGIAIRKRLHSWVSYSQEITKPLTFATCLGNQFLLLLLHHCLRLRLTLNSEVCIRCTTGTMTSQNVISSACDCTRHHATFVRPCLLFCLPLHQRPKRSGLHADPRPQLHATFFNHAQ